MEAIKGLQRLAVCRLLLKLVKLAICNLNSVVYMKCAAPLLTVRTKRNIRLRVHLMSTYNRHQMVLACVEKRRAVEPKP